MRKSKQVFPESAAGSRRRFFRLMLSEAIGFVEEIRGKPQMRLSELDQVSDEVLRHMCPVFNETSSYCIENNAILLNYQKNETSVEVCRLTPQELAMLRYFDGKHTLEEIGYRVAEEFGDGYEDVYQHVKAVFICLAKHFICFPAHGPDSHEK